MKLLKLTILLLLLCTPVQAQEYAMSPLMMGASGGAAAAVCNPTANEVGGLRTMASNSMASSNAWPRTFKATADCAGNLKTGTLYHADQGYTLYMVLCVYGPTTGEDPNDESLVGQSGIITAPNGGNDWYTSDVTASGKAVTNTSTYWVTLWAYEGNADTMNVKSDAASNSFWYKSNGLGTWGAAPPTVPTCPAKIGTLWNADTNSTAQPSAYFTIE
jgi:hypothetical protein